MQLTLMHGGSLVSRSDYVALHPSPHPPPSPLQNCRRWPIYFSASFLQAPASVEIHQAELVSPAVQSIVQGISNVLPPPYWMDGDQAAVLQAPEAR